MHVEISMAFQELEWKQRFRLQQGSQNPQTSPFRVDRSTTAFVRNRYGNVQPWDASRVKLKKPIGGSDYVNASPIILKSRVPKKPHSGASTPASTDQPSQIKCRYIATQGPKEGQFSIFWHMVMQETPGDVGVIIMLTQHFEGNKEKCAQYYPADMDNPMLILPLHEEGDEGEARSADDGEPVSITGEQLEPVDDGERRHVDEGDPFLDFRTKDDDADSLGTDSEAPQTSAANDEANKQSQRDSVTLLSTGYDAKVGCEVRKLQLTIGNEAKTIYHYYFGGWPDFGIVDVEDRMALIELTRVSKAVAGDAPRIVHCSAGVGRTGTWIALDFLLQKLEAGLLVESSFSPQPGTPTPSSTQQATNSNDTWGKSGPPKESTPDLTDEEDVIWDTVNTLREQRIMMVMNELQYEFLYKVLKEAFVEKYAEKETGPGTIEDKEPSRKVLAGTSTRKSVVGGMYQGTPFVSAKGGEETVGNEGGDMDWLGAETDIMEKDKGGGPEVVHSAAERSTHGIQEPLLDYGADTEMKDNLEI